MTMLLELNQLLILPFVRIATIMSCLPGMGQSFWEWRFRIVLAMLLSIILLPSLMPYSTPEHFLNAILWEGTLGLIIGFSLQLLLQLFVMLGKMIGSLSGFSFAKLIEPVHGLPETLMMQTFYIISVCMFFQLDCHLLVIQGLTTLFKIFPLGQEVMLEALIMKIAGAFQLALNQVMVIGLPFVALLSVVLVGFSLVGRYKFEFSLFTIGLPILILMVFILLSLKIDNILLLMSQIMQNYIVGVLL